MKRSGIRGKRKRNEAKKKNKEKRNERKKTIRNGEKNEERKGELGRMQITASHGC